MKERIYTNYKAEKFLSRYIPTSENQLVKSLKDIKINPPLVLKIISPDAIHKADIKGVRIIHHPGEIENNFNDLLSIVKKKKLKLDGIMVQKFYPGESVIIGLKKDPVFGHVVLVGLGGVFTEVLEDISIRKCPITTTDAQEMIDELKAAKIFKKEFRGQKLNTPLLKKTLVKVSQIPKRNPNIEELDINPFVLNEKNGRVVDARIVFSH